MSRYSRSNKDMRHVFLNEFLNNPDRGEKFYERVLMEYGDDSVAELGFAQVAMERLSNIAVQLIEDRRIGLSYLEKSSRYVSWTTKIDNNYAYYCGPDIVNSKHEKIYREACDFSFDTYEKSIPPIKAYLESAYPIDNFPFRDSTTKVEKPFSKLRLESDIHAAKRAYHNASNSMMMDLLRGLLPASALTNLGVGGNGRAFEYLISVMKSSHLLEVQKTGEHLATELKNTMGPFIRRTGEKYGRELEEYLAKSRRMSESPISKNAEGKVFLDVVRLVSYEPPVDALNTVVAGLLYEGCAKPFGHMLHAAGSMTNAQKVNLIQSFADLRKNRRQRPPRAFELVSYTFDMSTNYGMFRDIHRHRILTMQRQPLTVLHGFDMPPELEEAGISNEFIECMKKSAGAYHAMAATDPLLAQYVVNFAYKYRYMMRINLRELCHLVELRTLPQGHQDYRNVANLMLEQVQRVHPHLSQIIQFVDSRKYNMGRLSSEKRTASKIAKSRDSP